MHTNNQKNLSSIPILFLLLIFTACNEAPGEKKSTGVVAPPSPSKSAEAIVEKTPEEELKLYRRQSSVAAYLCSELQALHNKTECIGLKSLLDREAVVSCLNQDATKFLKTTFEIEAAAAKPVFVQVNSIFTHQTAIESGKRTPITWVNKGDKNIAPPRLVDLSQMKFVDSDGQSVSVSSFKLFVNGVEISSALTDNNRAAEFSSLQERYATSNCRMGQADIEKIKVAAVANESTVPAPEAKDLKIVNELLASQILALESEMTRDAKRGCWAAQKIEKLEIELTGSVVPVQDGCHPQHSGVEGNADEMVLKIADREISFKKGQLASGRIVLERSEFVDKTISELKDISFSMLGRRVQSVRTPACGNTLFFQTELDRPIIRSIRIKANGKTVYSRDDFESKFNQTGSFVSGGEVAFPLGNGFRAFESKIQGNAAYLDLVKSDDCR